jgi:ribosomal protein L34E
MENVGLKADNGQRRRAPYNTKSQKVRVIKTPGGELRYLHIKKKGTAPKCGVSLACEDAGGCY